MKMIYFLNRQCVVLLAIFYAVVVTMAHARTPQVIEENTDRMGADIRSFPIDKLPPGSFGSQEDICMRACSARKDCQAWTFGKQESICWLKSSIPEAKPRNSYTSGVVARQRESNTDRPGNDIADFPTGRSVGVSEVTECQSACEKNGACGAWTLVKPKIVNKKIVGYGKCFLKSPVPEAQTNKCCTSGVVDRFVPPK